jgi:Amt family ammonium transporter
LVNGIWGTIAVGIFSDKSLLVQFKGIVVIALFAFVASYVVLYVINKLIPLRVSQEDEYDGLDLAECGMESYPEFVKS